ncbi:hypothetical protein D3C85_1239770 [compost metagenome]
MESGILGDGYLLLGVQKFQNEIEAIFGEIDEQSYIIFYSGAIFCFYASLRRKFHLVQFGLFI